MSNASREDKRCCSCKARLERAMVCQRCLTNIYCSKRCQQIDWPTHAEDCRFVSWQRKLAEEEFCAGCLRHKSQTEKKMLRKCAACLRTRYCSKWCQQEDWPYHSNVCSDKYNHRSSSKQSEKSVDSIWTDPTLDPSTLAKPAVATTAAAATTTTTATTASATGTTAAAIVTSAASTTITTTGAATLSGDIFSPLETLAAIDAAVDAAIAAHKPSPKISLSESFSVDLGKIKVSIANSRGFRVEKSVTSDSTDSQTNTVVKNTCPHVIKQLKINWN